MEDKSIIIMTSWLQNQYVELTEEEQRELLWAIYKYSIGEDYEIPATIRMARSNFGQIAPQIDKIKAKHIKNSNGGKASAAARDEDGNRIKVDQKRVWQIMQTESNLAEVQRIISKEMGLPEGVLVPKGQIYEGEARAHIDDPGWGLNEGAIENSGEVKKNSGNNSFNF